MILTQNIIIHSTDDLTTYPDPKTFMDNLPNYMKIESQLPEGLGMVSIGQDAPDQQYQDIPWLELDENNNPLSLKYYNGVEWVETRAYRSIQAPYEGLYIQYGSVTMSHVQPTPNTWVDSITAASGVFLFPKPFKSGTTINIQITPITSSVLERSEGSQEMILPTSHATTKTNVDTLWNTRRGFQWTLGTGGDYRGFNMMTKTNDAPGAALQFKFNWMAIGEKA